MKIVLQSQENIQNVMRRCGYFSVRPAYAKASAGEGGKEELSFIRPIGSSGSGYPRFHIYVNMEKFPRETVINLHLDQKKPIYRGTVAHSGEYEGELVEKELERIKQILGPMVQR